MQRIEDLPSLTLFGVVRIGFPVEIETRSVSEGQCNTSFPLADASGFQKRNFRTHASGYDAQPDNQATPEHRFLDAHHKAFR